MPVAIPLIIAGAAVAGVGMQAFGMMKSQEGAATQAAAAQGQSVGARIQALGSQQQAEGAMTQVRGAGMQNEATKAITGLEYQVEAQRMQAMELDARRQQLEIVRAGQRARAMGLTAATDQGASKGSGLQGGYGQISGDTNTNLGGVQGNLAIGRNIFGINAGISQQRLNFAAGGDVINQGQGQVASGQGTIAQGAGVIAQFGGQGQLGQSQMQLGQGFMSLGGSLASNAGTFGNLAGSIRNPFGSGSTLSGWSGSQFNFPNGSIGGLY